MDGRYESQYSVLLNDLYYQIIVNIRDISLLYQLWKEKDLLIFQLKTY